MTEFEYVVATNLAKVRAAKTILTDMLPGDDCGVSEDVLAAAITALREIETGVHKRLPVLQLTD